MPETPRTSERPNKGVAPKRYEMEAEGKVNSPKPTTQQQLTTNMAAPSPAVLNTDSQQRSPQPDIMQVLANMQREMMKQISAVQQLIVTQRDQTTASITSLQKEIKSVADKVVVSEQSVPGTVSEAERIPNERTPSLATTRNGESLTNNSFHSQGSASHRAKIYPLPKFGGLPEEWPTFVEDFRQTTAEFVYTPLQNIIRIREALYGDAKETVESLLSSSRNVEMIINTLAQTFGRPEQLIRSQIDKVNAISFVPEGKLDLLVKFSTKVSNMVRFLQTANGKHHLSNPTLLSELVSKLPQSKQMQWAEKCIVLDRPVDLVDFCDWLDTVKRVANMVSDGLPSSSLHQNRKTQPKNKFALTTSAVKKCIVCSGTCQILTECQHFKDLSVDDRWKKARELRLCFSCLKGHHQVGKCFKKQRCGVDGCDKQHNYILHNTADSVDRRQTHGVATSSENENPRRNFHAGTQRSEILFQIIPIKLYGPKKSISTYAFIDDGADATMLEWDVGKQIGLKGNQDKLKLQWLNGHCSSQRTEMVELSISGSQDESMKYKISKIFLVKNLELPMQSFSINEVNHSSHLSKLPIDDYYKIKPQMILSLTHAFLTVPVEIPRCPDDNGPIAVKTRLGWVVYGPTGTGNEHVVKRVLHSRRFDEDVTLENIMKQYFEIESCMVKLDAKPVIPKDDERALSILKSTTSICDGRFQCGLLWKNDVQIFPNTYSSALRRLQLIERKFNLNKKFEIDYRSKMNHILNEGYARRLTPQEEKIISPKTFFLPHFAVSNPKKDSLRLVFDAAAKVQGTSLNDFLLPGPDLNQSLLAVMFKFREKPIAVCGDLKEMFLQIAIRKEDQEAQRFLYRTDVNQPVSQYVMGRAIFGATCSPTIAQYVKNVNAEKFAAESSRAVEAIVKRHYVDDYVDCFSTVEEAVKVVQEVINIHRHGGFVMHKIISNSEKINKHFGTPTFHNMNITSGNIEKILGMQWSPKTDDFVFDCQFQRVSAEILENKRIPTKREVLSLVMSVFDPFGLLCDFTISGKIFMQSLWKCGIEWDEEIPEGLCDSWSSWLCGLVKVRDFKIQRCYFSNINVRKRTLHIFCDASEMAMAVVAYWRIEPTSGPEVSFVAGKTNCAPTKFMTIPRLELQAAVFAVRLKNAIMKFHDIQPCQVLFWSDSSTVVQWIRSDHRRYKQFVANRVAEILESSEEKQWRWVPGEMNPADEGTRARLQYNPNGRWKIGPEFLRRPEESWPTRLETSVVADCDGEVRQGHFAFTTQVINNQIFNINRFSNYLRVKRSVGWIFRYCNNLKLKHEKQPLLKGDLTPEEEECAERAVIRAVQKTEFSEELYCLAKQKAIPSSSTIITLNPYIDEDDVIRCGGRIDNAPFISFSTKRPYILPKDHRLTRLIVHWYHNRQHHINDHTVICEIRRKYWIPSIRVVLKSVKAACCMCKLRKSKPTQPIMGPLPEDRLCAFVRPFSYTGVDYFGPVMVSIRRSHEKRWIALFTCLTTRAVHLEVATNLSSDSCLLCVRNFINRRGVPTQMRSDNGTNFVGLTKELSREEKFIDFDKIDDALKPLGIKWKFNTPSDPSAGGAWERLVQSVKKALYSILKEHVPRPETLYSLLVECENMVNARPLTHLPVTPEEPEPLTPNHFLLGCPNSTQTPAPFDPKLCSQRKQWRILQNLKNGLWKRWMAEYLPELTRRTKWCRSSKPMEIGSLVLICDSEQPRSKWRRGRVLKLFVGQDGVARSAEVHTVAGVLRRPVSKLAVLDVQESGEVDLVGSIHGGGDVGNPVPLK